MTGTEDDQEHLRPVLQDRIELGRSLVDKLNQPNLQKVTGLAKLVKKVRQEVKFLEKFEKVDKLCDLKKEHIQCSNLVHLHSIINQLFRCKNPVAVMQPYNLYDRDGVLLKKMAVDIVCEGGFSWLKVVARNPKALQLNSKGGNQYGQRSIIDQVREFVECSKQNQRMFRTAQVTFVFANGVTHGLARKVRKRGAQVAGDLVGPAEDNAEDESDDDNDTDSDNDACDDDAINDLTETEQPPVSEVLDESRLNLDITAMIAYVSSLTNGKSNYLFKDKIICEQAEWERERPVKPFLDKVFCDKDLICCESAVKDFKAIIKCLGGPTEKVRAEELMSRLTIIPDQESNKIKNLEFSGKIKDRSRAIFGTGDSQRVVTVTANSGFVRAAGGQGVQLAVVLHESRALTEDKQLRASQIEEEEESRN